MNTIRENSFVFIAILSVAAFILGWLIAPGDKVDHKGYEELRAKYELQKKAADRRLASLDSARDAIRRKTYTDSLYYAGLLKANQITITQLKKKADAVDYRNYSAADLDSVRAVILARANR